MRAVHAGVVLLAVTVAEVAALPSFTVAVAADAPAISVNPTTLSFGRVAVGAHPGQTITISNAGTAILTVSSVALAGGAASKYAVSATSLNIAAGGSQTITVTYSPTAETTDNDQLIITSNDPVNAIRTVALSGSGATTVLGNIALNPSSLDFGSLDVGTAKQLTTQIANTGGGPLIVTAIERCANTSDEYTWTATATPFPIAAGQSSTLTVAYTVNSTGTHVGCIVIESDDLQTPTVNLNVTGMGNPRGGDQTEPSSSGGCSTGEGSATVAALMLLATFAARRARHAAQR